MSLFTQWVPHTWADEPHTAELEAYADRVVDGYTELAPNFKQSIVHRQVIGPYEMEHEYGLLGGNIFHGELSADQLFHLRPAPGYADFTTPVAGLYQCSSATHGGGGVTGIPALLCTRRILSDRRAIAVGAPGEPGGKDRLVSADSGAGESGSAWPRCSIPRAAAACCPARRTPPTRSSTWEREQFFARTWLCAGRVSDLHEPGQRRGARVAGEGVLLVRAEDGTLARLRQHVSPPRSRAAAVRRDREARRDPLPVPRVDLRARRRAPGDAAVRAAAGLRSRENGLVALRVEEWNGWAMVNLSGDAPPLSEHVGALDALLANYQCDRLVTGAVHEYTMAANWKLPIENYHECYHCPAIHPELCVVSPPTSGDNYTLPGMWVGGTMDLEPFAATMSMDGRSGGAVLPRLDEKQRREIVYVGLFPNLLISAHPDYVMTHRIEPLSPSLSSVECEWLFAAEAVAAEASTRRTRSTSGTSPTVRTGRPARASSGAWPPGATGPGPSRPRRTPFSNGSP